MRLFPRFGENGKTVNDPAAFVAAAARAPLLSCLTSRAVASSPRRPESKSLPTTVAADLHVVAGRLTVTNRSVTPPPAAAGVGAACLNPLEGRAMSAEQKQSVVVLQGQVETLFPVLLLTGGPQAGACGRISSLALLFEFAPGGSRRW